MPSYRMWTVGGLALSAGEGYVGIQGNALFVVIRKEGEMERIAEYVLYGGGAGTGPKGGVSFAQGPQTSNDFDSPVEQANLLYGSVLIVETGFQLGIFNAGYADMTWLNGPAKGTRCSSSGYGLCLGASLSVGAGGVYMLKFLNWRYLSPDRLAAGT